MNLNLEEHIVVVTGGASGIGRAIALAFLTEGACVALWDASPTVADAAAELAKQTSRKVVGLCVDVTDMATVADALRRSENELGPVGHLVHAAAIGSGKFGFPF